MLFSSGSNATSIESNAVSVVWIGWIHFITTKLISVPCGHYKLL